MLVPRPQGAIAKLLTSPEFVLVLALVGIVSEWIARRQRPAAPLLLSAKATLLVAFFALPVALGPFADSAAPTALITGFAGVGAVDVPNAVERMHLANLPPGTPMIGNTTHAALDVVALIRGTNSDQAQSAAASTGCLRRSSGLLPVARSGRHSTNL